MDYETKAKDLSWHAYSYWQMYGALVAKHPKTGAIATLLVGVAIGLLF